MNKLPNRIQYDRKSAEMMEDEYIGFVDGLADIKNKCRHLIVLNEVYRVGFYQGQCGKPFSSGKLKICILSVFIVHVVPNSYMSLTGLHVAAEMTLCHDL